jgi:hypothetical protein
MCSHGVVRKVTPVTQVDNVLARAVQNLCCLACSHQVLSTRQEVWVTDETTHGASLDPKHNKHNKQNKDSYIVFVVFA